MATYIPGAKSYLPDFKPFTPDFKFLSNALDLRTNKYETNYKQLNDLYGKVVYADLSRGDTNEVRNQYADQLAPRLEQIASMDLSLAQNVDAAKAVFLPFFENDLVVKDMVATDQYRKELKFANRLLNSNDADVRDKYWDVGIRAMEYQMQDFIDASPDKALQMSIPKYVQNVNLAKRSEEILKESGYGEMESIEWSPDGRYIIKTTGGAQVAAPAYELLQSQLLSDPRVMQAYYTDAYVQMRDYVDNSMNEGMFSDIEAAKQAWANTTISAVEEQLGLQLQTAQTEQDVAKQNAEEWETYNNVYGIGAGTPEEKAMAEALNAYEASRKKTTRYDAALQEAATPTTDTDALLNRAYNLMMQTNIAGDLQTSALRYAEITRRIEIDEDPYFLADYKHRLKMNEIYYKASLEGSGDDDKTSEQTYENSVTDALAQVIGKKGEFGSVVLEEEDLYQDNQSVINQEASSVQSAAAATWVLGQVALEGASGFDGRLLFQANDENGNLTTYNVFQDEAIEILSRPENADIATNLVHNRHTQFSNTGATDVELANSLPAYLGEGAVMFGYEYPSVDGERAVGPPTQVPVDQNNNPISLKTYPNAVANPDIISYVRQLDNEFKAREQNLLNVYDDFINASYDNFQNILKTENASDFLASTADAGGIPSILDGWLMTPNGMMAMNPDAATNRKILSREEYRKAFFEGVDLKTLAKNPFFGRVLSGSGFSATSNSIELTKEELDQVNSGGLTLPGFGQPFTLTPDMVLSAEPNSTLFGLLPVMSYEVTYLRPAAEERRGLIVEEAADQAYEAQIDLLNNSYKRGANGEAGFNKLINARAAFAGKGSIYDLSQEGRQISATINPRSTEPNPVGYKLLEEITELIQNPNVEVKYRAVGADDDLRGKDLDFVDLRNSERAQDFLNNVVFPDFVALRTNPGTGEQTTSDLYFTIDKTDIANITDDYGEAITTYTLNINPLYIDKYKQTGKTGVDLFGTSGLDESEQALRTTDFTKIQIRVKKDVIESIVPDPLGDATEGSDIYALMRANGNFTNVIPRGGGYTIWVPNPDDPLAISIQTENVVRQGDQYISVPNSVKNLPAFGSMKEFTSYIKSLDDYYLDLARSNNLSK